MLPQLDPLDDVAEPDAEALEAEEALEAVEAREEAEGLFDEAAEDDAAVSTDADGADVLELVEDAGVDVDEDDDQPGGGDPARYDELDLEDVVVEPEPETLDELDDLEAEPDVLDEDVLDDLEDELFEDDVDEDVLVVDEPTVTPVPAAARSGRARKREYVPARRVRRTIRRIDPVSLAKLALVFNLCFLAMVLVAGIIIWTVASASGSIDNIESFVADIGFDDFQLRGGQLLRGIAVGGFVLALAGAFFAFILGVLFNLLSDLVGGIRVTMVEPDER